MTKNDEKLLAVFPDPAPIDVARTLDLSGYSWKAVNSSQAIDNLEPSSGWFGAVVDCSQDPESAWAICRALRRRENRADRIIVLVTGAQLADLEMRDELFDDFVWRRFTHANLTRACAICFIPRCLCHANH